MNHYLIYDSFGNIVQTGHCPDEDIPQPGPGLRVIAGVEAVPSLYYVKDGELAPYTPEQVTARATHPGFNAHWDNAAMAWIDDRSLDEFRAAKWSEIKQARDAAEWAGFVWDGSTFDSDEVSQGRVQGAALAATVAAGNAQPFSVDWTLADNTVRTLDGPSMIQVGMALLTHINTQHEKGRQLRVQIEDPNATREQIAAIAW
jgi:hypothetical protein